MAIQPPKVENSKLCGKWRGWQPVRVQLRLDVGTKGAGLDACRAAYRVDFQHPSEALHVERNGAGKIIADGRFDAAADAAAATKRNHRHLAARRPVEDVDDRLLV